MLSLNIITLDLNLSNYRQYGIQQLSPKQYPFSQWPLDEYGDGHKT